MNEIEELRKQLQDTELSASSSAARVTELENRYVGQRSDCGHLKGLTVGVLGSPISETCIGCLTDKAQARVAELERDNHYLEGQRDEAQAHAARLAAALKSLADDNIFDGDIEKAQVALSATPAESLAGFEIDMQNAGAQAFAKLLLTDDGSGQLSPGPCADALGYLRALEAEHEAAIAWKTLRLANDAETGTGNNIAWLECVRRVEALKQRAAVEAAKGGGR